MKGGAQHRNKPTHANSQPRRYDGSLMMFRPGTVVPSSHLTFARTSRPVVVAPYSNRRPSSNSVSRIVLVFPTPTQGIGILKPSLNPSHAHPRRPKPVPKPNLTVWLRVRLMFCPDCNCCDSRPVSVVRPEAVDREVVLPEAAGLLAARVALVVAPAERPRPSHEHATKSWPPSRLSREGALGASGLA